MGRKRALASRESQPKIALAPDFTDSWFDPPVPTDSESVGVWPPSTKFPTFAGNKLPEKLKNKDPLKFKFQCNDVKLENFLTLSNKFTDKNNKIKLNPKVFSCPSYDLPKGNVGPTIDVFLREELTDNLITDEFIDINERLLSDVTSDITGNPSGLSDSQLLALIKPKLELIRKTNMLASASNLRGRSSIMSTLAFNKTALRNEVLDNFTGGSGQEHTKETLKGTSFFAHDLFGPIPQSLLDTCISTSRNDFILKPKRRDSAQGSHTSATQYSTSSRPILTATRKITQPQQSYKSPFLGRGFQAPFNPPNQPRIRPQYQGQRQFQRGKHPGRGR